MEIIKTTTPIKLENRIFIVHNYFLVVEFQKHVSA